ncbi:MAG: S26 family signal peptidase [Hyphomicrobiales bacterium]|nr:MAG: S26 family signal peptidase [Hyphomicrobiales bacterium]
MGLRRVLAACAGIAALAGTTLTSSHPIVVWNASDSVPIGLYQVVYGEPRRGDLVVIRLPQPLRSLAQTRGYVPSSVFLLKPVVAMPGDRLCRRGELVTINGRPMVFARVQDAQRRPLPRWHGCRLLGRTDLAVISRHIASFDSRYFGPLDRYNVVGVAAALWTTPAQP